MDRKTAKIAEPILGGKLYQKRARQALPILVRQAEAGNSIIYSDLANELGMSNARNLNYVLGSIGRTMENLSKSWKEKVPPIQCLVVNKNTHLPGAGIGWFLVKEDDFASLPPSQKRAIVKAELAHIFAYPRWRDVLSFLQLDPPHFSYEKVNKQAAGRGGGESESHRKLKEFIASHPEAVDLPYGTSRGKTEYPLPSGDKLDISFATKNGWVAVEVKSKISTEADIARGLYQCVKYVAVMRAVEASENRVVGGQALLALGSALPARLVPLKNMLGVTVIENISTD